MKQEDIPTVRIDDQPTVVQGHTQPRELEKALGHNDRRYTNALQLALGAGCLLLSYFIVSSLFPELSDFYANTVRPFLVRYWPNMLASLALPVLAFNLYLFRTYQKFAFGLAESAFGIGIGWYGVNKMVDSSVFDGFVVLVAGLYLVGRGFINTRFPLPVDEPGRADPDSVQIVR